MNPSVCVLIVNWNGWRDTIECLETVFRLNYDNFRVVVCDNGSSDDSLTRIKAWATGDLDAFSVGTQLSVKVLSCPPIPKPIKFIEIDRQQAEASLGAEGNNWDLVLVNVGENLGFAGGNNVGLRLALTLGFEFFWLLNNDTVVEPQSLTALVKRIHETADIGMCGSTLLYYHRPERVQALGGGYYCKWIGLPWHQGRLKKASDLIDRFKSERWMNYIVGASILVPRKFVQDVGLMCEDYFLFFEEYDWILRGRKKYRLAYAPDSVVYHKVGGSIGTSSNPDKKSLACDYYNIKNRIFFTRRFFPEALPVVYISLISAVFIRLLFGRWDRAWMIICLLLGSDRKPIELG